MAVTVKCAVWSTALLSICSALSRSARTCALCQWLAPLTVPLGGWELPHLQPRMELWHWGQGQGQAAHPELQQSSSCRVHRLSWGGVLSGHWESPKPLFIIWLSPTTSWHGEAPLTPHRILCLHWLGCLLLGWRQDTSGNARGSQPTCLRWAPSWAVFGCVCAREHPLQLHPEPHQEQHGGSSTARDSVEQQHNTTQHRESRVGRTG